VVGMCLDKGCVWAQNQGQGETLALIPNMMDNQGGVNHHKHTDSTRAVGMRREGELITTFKSQTHPGIG